MNIVKSTVLALAMIAAPLTVSAATCSPGTCSASQNGNDLSVSDIGFSVQNIQNGGPGNNFMFSGDFSTGGVGAADIFTSVLSFATTSNAYIKNLVLSLSDGMTVLSYNITDANGAAIGREAGVSDVVTRVNFSGFYGEDLTLAFSGEAVKSRFGSSLNPSIEAGISAVPLPAGGLLLISALGGAAALRRRKTKQAA